MNKPVMILICAMMLAATTPAHAGPLLFEDDTVLEVTLRGPLGSVLKKKSGRPEYPFNLSTGGETFPIEVRYRGHSRLRLCKFPPLRLDFPSEELSGSIFDGVNKVKMVTHCKPGGGDWEDSLINEYLAYRIYNLISPVSYRVRLLRVTYVDTEGKAKKLDRPYYAYLIEPDEVLAARVAGQPLEVGGVDFSLLNERQIARVSVFEYVIGNSDWSLARAYESDTCCHNIDLLETADGWQPVPYDFDLSALVGARYRGSANQSRSRQWGGYCRSSDESLAAALDHFRAHREAIMAVVREAPAVSDKARRKRVKFIESFFGRENEFLLARFRNNCIG